MLDVLQKMAKSAGRLLGSERRPRWNIEFCIYLDRVGFLVAGWLLDPDARIRKIAVLDGRQTLAVVSELQRYQREDVTEALADEYPANVFELQPKPGFVAVALAPHARREQHVIVASDGLRTKVPVQRFVRTLSTSQVAYFLHALAPMLRAMANVDVLGAPSVHKLCRALGSAAVNAHLKLERGARRPWFVALDGCIRDRDHGIALVGVLRGEPRRIVEAHLSAKGHTSFNLMPSMSYFVGRDSDSPETCIFTAVALSPALGSTSDDVAFQIKLDDGTTHELVVDPSEGADAVEMLDPPCSSDVWLALDEAADGNWPALRIRAAQARGALPAVFERSANVRTGIDRTYLVPGRGVVLVGWMIDTHDPIVRLTANHDHTCSEDASSRIVRFSRQETTEPAEADNAWFAVFLDLPGATQESLTHAFHVTLITRSAASYRLRPSNVRVPGEDPLPTITELLTLVPGGVDSISKLSPALEGLWGPRPAADIGVSVVDVGSVVNEPDVSVIVPIPGRADFMQYQMSLFAGDPEISAAEVIYVMGDTALTDDTVRAARELYALFRVSCRIVVPDCRAGAAVSNNLGASVARGRLLLLLNSAVFPKSHGWLGELRRAHDALPNVGAVGPKLLFADGSIEHAGIQFDVDLRYPGLFLHVHPRKGFPNEAQPTDPPNVVPAITSACLLVERSRYMAAGGLDRQYILGGFEGSDFCLKLRQAGRFSYYVPSVELFYLEPRLLRTGDECRWQSAVTLYNAWRETRKWGELIRQSANGFDRWTSPAS